MPAPASLATIQYYGFEQAEDLWHPFPFQKEGMILMKGMKWTAF